MNTCATKFTVKTLLIVLSAVLCIFYFVVPIYSINILDMYNSYMSDYSMPNLSMFTITAGFSVGGQHTDGQAVFILFFLIPLCLLILSIIKANKGTALVSYSLSVITVIVWIIIAGSLSFLNSIISGAVSSLNSSLINMGYSNSSGSYMSGDLMSLSFWGVLTIIIYIVISVFSLLVLMNKVDINTEIKGLKNQFKSQPMNYTHVTYAAPAKICPVCGNPVSEGNAFCQNCGTKIETKHYCQGCGKELIPGSKFCQNCGKAC